MPRIRGIPGDQKRSFSQRGDVNNYVTDVDPREIFEKGSVGFEAGKITHLTESGCAAGTETATYEIYLIKEDGHVIAMQMKLVGDDPCLWRKSIMDNPYFQYTGLLFFILNHLLGKQEHSKPGAANEPLQSPAGR